MTDRMKQRIVDVCRKAVDTFGWEQQSLIAVEEMSELQKEIIKKHRGMQNEMHIGEEIADVFVTLIQLCMMFGIRESVEQALEFKAERLEKKIEGRVFP